MIIYEVDIAVNESIYSQYNDWLKDHIVKMMSNEGFADFKKYKYLDKSNKNHIIIHYFIENMSALELYFSEGAKKMRKEGTDLFEGNITIKRKVMQPCK